MKSIVSSSRHRAEAVSHRLHLGLIGAGVARSGRKFAAAEKDAILRIAVHVGAFRHTRFSRTPTVTKQLPRRHGDPVNRTIELEGQPMRFQSSVALAMLLIHVIDKVLLPAKPVQPKT